MVFNSINPILTDVFLPVVADKGVWDRIILTILFWIENSID